MPHITADRVRDTATTTGTGAFTVTGSAPVSYRTFSAVCATSDTFYYCIAHQTADEWEVGLGTYSALNQITRTTVLRSSNAGVAVNFTAGTKDVFITLSADRTVEQNDQRSVVLSGGTLTTSQPILDLTQTWNAGAVTFTGFRFNVTDTASAAASLIADFQVGGSSRASITKDGILQGGNPSGFNSVGLNLRNGSGVGAFVNANGVGMMALNSGTTTVNLLNLGFTSGLASSPDILLTRDGPEQLALRNGVFPCQSRIYASFVSATNFQRLTIRTIREVSPTLSGASYTTTATIPAYAHLIGVTTRVNTAITGATSYSVGDGTDVDLWGATIPVAANSESRTANFTAVAAVGAAATARSVTLTANGANFTGGVVEICFHFMTTEAD